MKNSNEDFLKQTILNIHFFEFLFSHKWYNNGDSGVSENKSTKVIDHNGDVIFGKYQVSLKSYLMSRPPLCFCFDRVSSVWLVFLARDGPSTSVGILSPCRAFVILDRIFELGLDTVNRGTNLPPLCKLVTATKKKNENNKIWFREKQKEKFEKAFKKKKWKESCALVLLQSQPPMCFSPMNTLGTVRCPVHSARADWTWAPSPLL